MAEAYFKSSVLSPRRGAATSTKTQVGKVLGGYSTKGPVKTPRPSTNTDAARRSDYNRIQDEIRQKVEEKASHQRTKSGMNGWGTVNRTAENDANKALNKYSQIENMSGSGVNLTNRSRVNSVR